MMASVKGGVGAFAREVTVRAKKTRLVFGKGNGKLKDVHTFSLPAGWTCPYARECLSRADRTTGAIKDGKETRFRCFAASMERMTSVRVSRWRNLEALKRAEREGGLGAMVRLILASLPKGARTVRVHVSGDFWSQLYFDAWNVVAWVRPDVLFYAYTKAIPLWAARLGSTPSNFVLTASKGGTHDDMAETLGMRTARVVLSEGEAEALGLAIDHDDSLAMGNGGDFALLIHGTQPPGSGASKAWQIVKGNSGGYGEKSRRVALATV
jgi:hypothetical protein